VQPGHCPVFKRERVDPILGVKKEPWGTVGYQEMERITTGKIEVVTRGRKTLQQKILEVDWNWAASREQKAVPEKNRGFHCWGPTVVPRAPRKGHCFLYAEGKRCIKGAPKNWQTGGLGNSIESYSGFKMGSSKAIGDLGGGGGRVPKGGQQFQGRPREGNPNVCPLGGENPRHLWKKP